MGGTDGVAGLGTASVAMRDKVDLPDHLRLEYGFSLESVSYIDRLNYMSPFARATYNLGDKGSIRFAYSSGMQPTELLAHGNGPVESNQPLSPDLAALAQLPRVPLPDPHAPFHRTQNSPPRYQIVQ